MKIRNKLTLLFTLLIAGILLGFAVLIYLSAANDRERAFYDALQKEATSKVLLLLETRVDAATLQTIYRNNREILNEVEVAIYNPDFVLLYHDAVEIDFVKETPEMIDEIIEAGEIRFVQEGWQVLGFRFAHDGNLYAITAAAFDGLGYDRLERLRNTLAVLWIGIVAIIWLAGRYMSGKALEPVSAMVDNVERITATNLDLRIDTGNNVDEIAELAITFNAMLDRLENSFDAQKLFVSNISHELRTPLAAIIAELELALSRDRDNETYKKAIQNVLDDARKLSRLSTGLLDLAKASYDKTEIHFSDVRLDELLVTARSEVVRANPGYQVNLIIDESQDDDRFLTVTANAYLLKVAFVNLIENGCKFSSPPECNVTVSGNNNVCLISFTDHGTGITEEDLKQVFKPFFRGLNKNKSHGHGIGLPLTQKIIYLHKGQISITSDQSTGTKVQIELPVMKN